MKNADKQAQALYKQAQQHFDANDFPGTYSVATAIEQMANFPELDHTIRMKVLSMIGICLLQMGDHRVSERYLLRSLDIAQQLGDRRAIYIRYENLAAVYISSRQHQKAIEYLQLSIEIKEASGNYADIPRGMIQLASLQFGIEHTEAGRETLRKASALIRKYDKKELLAILHFNIAMQLKREQKYSRALQEYTRAIRYAHIHHDHGTIARAYNNQGDIYIQLSEWRKAEKKFMACIDVSRTIQLMSVVFTASIQLGRIALELHDVKKCREIFDYVSSHAHESDEILLHKDLAELSVMLYEAEGDHRAALEAHRRYVGYYKRFYDNELSRAVLDMQAKYETERSERELQKANLRQVESELKALRAQMDPHFIFNALSSMRREMLEGNIESADKYLVRFSKLLRMILDTSRRPLVRLSENIELLHLYIQIENARQGHRFDYDISVRGLDPESVYIPGLILQPLAENAIVHGLNPKKNGRGKLHILLSKAGDTLRITVTDNGVGRLAASARDREDHTSHAMNIIRETLYLIWKEKNVTDFLIIKDLMKNNFNTGTEVEVRVPLSLAI